MLDSEALKRALILTNPTPCTNEEEKRIKAKQRNGKINESVECQDEINEIVNKIKNDNKRYKIDDFPVELSFTTKDVKLDTLKIDKDFFIASIRNHIYLYPKEFKRYFYKKAENISLKNYSKGILNYWTKALKKSSYFHILLLILIVLVLMKYGTSSEGIIWLFGIWGLSLINLGLVLEFGPNSYASGWLFVCCLLPFPPIAVCIYEILHYSKSLQECEEAPDVSIKTPKELEQITTFFTKKGMRIFVCR